MEAIVEKPKRKYARKFSAAFARVVKYLESKGAKPLFCGSHRAAMIRGEVVYKLPVDLDGIEANFQEDYFFNKMCKKKEYLIPYIKGRPERGGYVMGFARCKIVWINSVPVLMMERLVPFHRGDDRITCDMASMDGGQFGESRRGDYLCYDYSRTVKWQIPEYPQPLNEKIGAYNEKFHRIFKGDRWANTFKFDVCRGVPSIEKVKIILES